MKNWGLPRISLCFYEALFGKALLRFFEASFGKALLRFYEASFGKALLRFYEASFGKALLRFYEALFGKALIASVKLRRAREDLQRTARCGHSRTRPKKNKI